MPIFPVTELMSTTSGNMLTSGTNTESAAQLFARLKSAQLKTGVEPLDRLVKFSPGQIQFIQGPKASGKTELLYQLLTSCILPKEWRSIELGGHECGVLLFDTDLKFDLQRVLTLLHYKFVQAVRARGGEAKSPPEEIESELELVFKASLQRLHVIKCGDAFTFRTSLHALQHESLNDTRVLMIDSFDVFYWEHKHVTRDTRARVQDEELLRSVVSKCQMLTAVLTVSAEYRAPTSHVLKGVKHESSSTVDHVIHMARRSDADWPIEISYLQHHFQARVTSNVGLEVSN